MTLDQPKEEAHNLKQLNNLLVKVHPSLHSLIKEVTDNRVNPWPIVKIIRQMVNVADYTGYGKVEIVISDGYVLKVAGTSSEKLKDEAVKDTVIQG